MAAGSFVRLASQDRSSSITGRKVTRPSMEASLQLTATMIATAASTANCRDRRQLHNARAIRANLGYVRPEKQTVEDQRRAAATVAKPLDGARRTGTTLEYRPSVRTATDGSGRLAHSYGADSRAAVDGIGDSNAVSLQPSETHLRCDCVY